jgi:hypothetical protein
MTGINRPGAVARLDIRQGLYAGRSLVQHASPITPAGSDLKSVGIGVGVVGIAVSLFMAVVVAGLNYYHAIFYAVR